jgi:hypothetical protein
VDFIDQLRQIAARIPKQREHIKTEEATKTALVLPFIHALGYSPYDPTEVVPEFTADVPGKKGERVDYAILRDGKPIMLIECKPLTANLDAEHFEQLFRYYTVTEAKVGILTNGVVYRFFTELDAPNKMDERPFLELNLLDLQDAAVEEVKKVTKAAFDVDQLMGAARDLKWTREIKGILAAQLTKPDDELVRFFAGRIVKGNRTQKVMQAFAELTVRALHQFVSEAVNDRLKRAQALNDQAGPPTPPQVPQPPNEPVDGKGDGNQVVTTDEELEAHHIVKAILRESVDPKRIVMRDTASYCGVLLDDNNRKPLIRFRFGANKRILAFMTASKDEEKVPIGDLNEIYQHADRLKATVGFYDK